MDHRILIAAVAGLVLVAFGGFYFAIGGRSHNVYVPPTQTASAPSASKTAPPSEKAAPPAKVATAGVKVTAADIEAEIDRSDFSSLQKLLKKHFADEYKGMIDLAVRRRIDGGTEAALGQEAFSRFQEIMRSKLKFAVAAGMPLIDKLAANEMQLFHTLGTEGPSHCLGVLGKADKPEAQAPPDNIKRLMRQATIFRFEAIADGMPKFAPVEPLTPAELGAFEASLAQAGLKLDEVRSGGFLNKEGTEPGKPCLMVEKLYTAVSRLDDSGRRKLYASMFFLGREK